MEELPQQFPIREVSADVLADLARRAREQHALGASDRTPASTPGVQRQASPLVLTIQKWMRGAELGVLDLAAIAALICLSVSLLWMYAGPSRPKTGTNGANGAAAKLAGVTPPAQHADDSKLPAAPEPKFEPQKTVVGDGPDAPQTPEPAPTPAPAPTPQPPATTELLKLKATAEEREGPPEDIQIPPGMNRAEHLPNPDFAPPGAPNPAAAAPKRVDYSFGNRNGGARRLMVKRYGGSLATEDAVDLALRWLAYHQEADGHFDAVKYGSGQKTDTAMTALATLAFLGAGHTEKAGAYKDNVRRAIAWLISKQQDNGLVYDPTDAGAHRGIGYPHGIATLALAEAAGMARVPETAAAAQKAVDYCVNVQQDDNQNGRAGWRYQPNQPGDICVSGWYIAALKSAKVALLHVNARAFDHAIGFLDSVTANAAGVAVYNYQPGSGSNHRRGAIGNYCRVILGWKTEDLQRSVEAFVSKGGLPNWGENGNDVDMYYWYYGSLSTFQQGGEIWKQWNDGLKKTLTENQCKQGDDSGSWPVVGEFSGEWGRVGQTAFGALCCEIYYRYPRMNEPIQGGIVDRLPPDPPNAGVVAAAAKPPALGDKLNTKVTFNVVDKKLTDMVTLLNELTEVKVKLAPGLKGRDAQLTLRVTEMPLDRALTWTCQLVGLDWHEQNGVVVIDEPKPDAPNPQPQPARKKDEF